MPYVCVPTAASMDGYAASGAALRDDGFKRTFACAAPVAIVADLDVIRHGAGSHGGLGLRRLVGKLVAGADWIVADALGVEASIPAPSPWFRTISPPGSPSRRRATRRARRARWADARADHGRACHAGTRQLAAGQRQRPPVCPPVGDGEEIAVGGMPESHGACVGIGCLSMLAAYEWLLRQDVSSIAPAELAARNAIRRSAARRRRGIVPLPFMAANAEAEAVAKAADPQAIETRLRRLQASWPRVAGQLRQSLPAAATVRRWLEAAGAPASPAAIGISANKHAQDYKRARLIRAASPARRRAARAWLAGRDGERPVRRQWILERVPGRSPRGQVKKGRQHGQDKTGMRRRAARHRQTAGLAAPSSAQQRSEIQFWHAMGACWASASMSRQALQRFADQISPWSPPTRAHYDEVINGTIAAYRARRRRT